MGALAFFPWLKIGGPVAVGGFELLPSTLSRPFSRRTAAGRRQPASFELQAEGVRNEITRFYDEEGATLLAAQQQGLLTTLPLDLFTRPTRSLVNGLAYLMISDDPQVRGPTSDLAAEIGRQVKRVFGLGLLPRPS